MSDFEYPDVFNRSTPRARKDHRCCECGGWIWKGETYERVQGLWDGSWSNFKTCTDCAALRARVIALCDRYDDGPVFGDLAGHVWEGDLLEQLNLVRCSLRRYADVPGYKRVGWLETYVTDRDCEQEDEILQQMREQGMEENETEVLDPIPETSCITH